MSLVTDIRVASPDSTRYSARINGEMKHNITAASRFWAIVQKAIDEGAEVMPFPVPDLEEVKKEKIDKIDRKTEKNILSGFSHNSEVFSCSEHAQFNLVATQLDRVADVLTYPFPWSTLDGGSTMITSDVEWDALYGAAKNHIRTQKIAGLMLRAEVQAAPDKDAVEAIEDNR